MVQLESISKHVVVDTTTQRSSRSCVISGISLGEYVVVIDTGHALEVGRALRAELEEWWGLPVRYWFLSHTHNDHRDGREAFKDATLITSSRCLANMPQRIRLGRWPQQLFEKECRLEASGLQVEFFHVGGHSVGHSVAYVPHDRVLFGCDLFIVGSVNFGLPFMSFYQNKPKRTGDPEAYLRAYRRFQTMDLKVIVPGHGDLVYNPQEFLKDQISFFSALKEHVSSAIQKGLTVNDFELPRIGPIEQAYREAEARRQRSRNLRFLENYLQHLKTSFYNYYHRALFNPA
jgi:glyoxylase-like metal-dependent hydrolase (beta-lactamase superfamily II)